MIFRIGRKFYCLDAPKELGIIPETERTKGRSGAAKRDRRPWWDFKNDRRKADNNESLTVRRVRYFYTTEVKFRITFVRDFLD